MGVGGSHKIAKDGTTHYQRNKLYYINKAQEYRKEVKRLVTQYKKIHPCVDCNNSDFRVLEFDHLPGNKKSMDIAVMVCSRSIDSVMKEIAKCDILCANCHRIRTWKRTHL